MSNAAPTPSRDQIADRYLSQLPFAPYPLQEDALLAWFAAEQGALICAPTGTGKTLIAEAALFEALHTGTTAYYTTPLIALTEQKYREMREAAVRWGFSESDVGLVTGNRKENADAKILVVVAEILANRLLHREQFDFNDVSAVVMDEFHSFADPERGIVWELSLALLPPHVRTLLLSATVGNAAEFVQWLRMSHKREIELVEGTERKVPLSFYWVGDELLNEHLEEMADGDEVNRRTPALVFCFNREECWNVAEQIKGKSLLNGDQQARLTEEIKQYDWSEGAGPKLKQILLRGVGVHHAGVLPKYRRIVEELFQKKLLSIAVCTETLAAGINLPARSVVLPNLVKGPPDKRKIIDPSSAHQIFGRAGRPQFDSQGYVYVLAHEDDVKIARWKEKYDQIPETTKDPQLLRAKKDLKRKAPKRRTTETYWNEAQFEKLRDAPPGKLYSRGPIPWRLLAYMLEATPEVEPIRQLVAKRLMISSHIEAGQKGLVEMLLTLHRAGYVTLEPTPPKLPDPDELKAEEEANKAAEKDKPKVHTFESLRIDNLFGKTSAPPSFAAAGTPEKKEPVGPPPYRPEFARPTDEMYKLHLFRGVNPLYGVFLINQLGSADRAERIQAFESVLELPRSLGSAVRVPRYDELPPGQLATLRIDPLLLQLGLATEEELRLPTDEEREYQRSLPPEERTYQLAFADKLRRLFNYDFPHVHDLRTSPVWAAGEVMEYGNFNKYVTSKNLHKQEGMIFRHLLRMILLVKEFMQLTPPDATEEEWRGDLREISDKLTEICRGVDPASADKVLEEAEQEAPSGPTEQEID